MNRFGTQINSRNSEIRCAIIKPIFNDGWKLKVILVGGLTSNSMDMNGLDNPILLR